MKSDGAVRRKSFRSVSFSENNIKEEEEDKHEDEEAREVENCGDLELREEIKSRQEPTEDSWPRKRTQSM